MKIAKYVIQVNFQENYELLEAIGKGSFSKVQFLLNEGSKGQKQRHRQRVRS